MEAMIFDYQQEGTCPSFDQLVLLSQSPRRRELLAHLKPEVQSVSVDERAIEAHYAEVYADEDFLTRVAKTACEIAKAKCGEDQAAGRLYLAADTMVIHQDQIYHKPQSEAEAKQMLTSYLGQTHQVVTAVAMKASDYLEVFYTVAELSFIAPYPGVEDYLDWYIQSGSPMDKSGGYGIQEVGAMLLESMRGNLYTVIGLPVSEVQRRVIGSYQGEEDFSCMQ